MNWKQLYNSSKQKERLQMVERMLRFLEARQQRVIFTGNSWVRNRRRGYQAHFLNDRRDGRHTRARVLSLVTFAVVLVSVSVATWALVVNVSVQIGIPVLFFHVTSLMAILAFKPSSRKSLI